MRQRCEEAISIHAPRTGSDSCSGRSPSISVDFNPRSPHGERRACRQGRAVPSPISIHAPRTGSDPNVEKDLHRQRHFNPRSPHGERPISLICQTPSPDFNPRSPHGERQELEKNVKRLAGFQSTLPARGATKCRRLLATKTTFQSTLPARGATVYVKRSFVAVCVFQSTLPARGATRDRQRQKPVAAISIHAPRTGSDHAASASVPA